MDQGTPSNIPVAAPLSPAAPPFGVSADAGVTDRPGVVWDPSLPAAFEAVFVVGVGTGPEPDPAVVPTNGEASAITRDPSRVDRAFGVDLLELEAGGSGFRRTVRTLSARTLGSEPGGRPDP